MRSLVSAVQNASPDVKGSVKGAVLIFATNCFCPSLAIAPPVSIGHVDILLFRVALHRCHAPVAAKLIHLAVGKRPFAVSAPVRDPLKPPFRRN